MTLEEAKKTLNDENSALNMNMVILKKMMLTRYTIPILKPVLL